MRLANHARPTASSELYSGIFKPDGPLPTFAARSDLSWFDIMSFEKITLAPEHPNDASRIEAIHEAAFGPERFQRTAFLIRGSTPPDSSYCLIAKINDQVVGSVRMTNILIGDTKAHLLGPLAVDPDFANLGAGRALVKAVVSKAKTVNKRAILLIGDLDYYAPLGFERTPHGAITLPGPFDPDRLLLCDFDTSAGTIKGPVTSVFY